MVWKPHLTVAAIIEKNHRFLLVEEQTSDGLQFNQPAGHLEENEDLISAVKREVFEETAWHFDPEHIIAIQLWRKNPAAPTFFRICFSGHSHSHNPNQMLDEGIVAAHWLTFEEIQQKGRQQRLRSPLVILSIEDYLSGYRYPLSLLKCFLDLS